MHGSFFIQLNAMRRHLEEMSQRLGWGKLHQVAEFGMQGDDIPWQVIRLDGTHVAIQAICPNCAHILCTFERRETRCEECGHPIRIPEAVATCAHAASAVTAIRMRDTHATTRTSPPDSGRLLAQLLIHRLAQWFTTLKDRKDPWVRGQEILERITDDDGTPWLIVGSGARHQQIAHTICRHCRARTTITSCHRAECRECRVEVTIPSPVAASLTVERTVLDPERDAARR
ncbi:hypothetical protein HY632_05235 [Candidatus Uhrbacteria bacterium]|nr:hypothetical protein [Candidatus Uhrbacteria bacterium]